MTLPKIYVTRPVFAEALALLHAVAIVDVWSEETPPPYEVLIAKARGADGLFTLLTDRIDSHLLESSPRLRVVSNMAVGYNNIDVATATGRGIYVGNTPNVLTETTAEFAMALLLSFARRIPEAQRAIHHGLWKTWAPMDFLGTDLHGTTLGVIGLGRIGETVARMARGFGMRVVYHSRTRKPEVEEALGLEHADTLYTLLAQSDYVTLHVLLNSETYRLIGDRELRSMRPTAVLVNTARGEVVDTEALRRALEVGDIAGAALDVTDPEPLPPDDPLLQLDNLLVTPHIASASRATRLKMATMAAQNIVEALQGHVPSNCVNPEAGQVRQ